MPLNYVTITGTFDDGSGTALSGTAIFTPSQTVFANGIPLVSAGIPVSVAITGGILQSVHLLATDNTGLSYEGGTGFFFWSVSFTLGGVSQPGFSFFLPHTPTTVDLTALANTAAGGGFSSPLTTLGDLLSEDATPTAVRVAGNTSSTKKFLTQTGTGTVSALPAWGTIAAGDLPTGTTGTQGALQLDGTAADIQPLGVQAAGAIGKAADSGHVHPFQAWQFAPEAYGAKANGVAVTDAAITSGTNTLACTTSTPFTSTAVDGGKTVYIPGAGASGADLLTTISTVTDSGHAVLAANAGTTVSAKGMVFGTDDTAAIKSAISAAATYATTAINRPYAEIVFSNKMYVVAGGATVGATFQGNAIFPLPLVSSSARKITLVFKGWSRAVDTLPHWLQPTVQAAGSTLAVLNLSGTNDATYGPAFVVGGPWNGYGGENGTFNNMCVVVDGLQISPPFNSTYGGWGFMGTAQARVLNGSYMPLAIVPSGGAWPQFNQSNITNQWSYALMMPAEGNNDISDVLYWSGYGATYGLLFSEHTVAESVRTNYCIVGLEAYAQINATIDAARIKYASVESCARAVGVLPNNIVRFQIDTLDITSIGSPQIILDSSNFARASIGLHGAGGGWNGTSLISGGNFIRVVNLENDQGPISSPQAAPSSGSAWTNLYYVDAEITLSVSGGTLSALSLTGLGGTVSQTVPGSTTFYRFTLNSGQAYTPTYTGTLTHTVTLI